MVVFPAKRAPERGSVLRVLDNFKSFNVTSLEDLVDPCSERKANVKRTMGRPGLQWLLGQRRKNCPPRSTPRYELQPRAPTAPTATVPVLRAAFTVRTQELVQLRLQASDAL